MGKNGLIGLFFGGFIIMPILVILFYLMLANFICNKVTDNGKKTFIEGVGKISKDVKTEFNKGYEADSTKKDSVK